MFEQLEKGSKAYFDSFSGLIPCKVLSISTTWPHNPALACTAQTVTLVLTANRGAYKRGEVITTNGLHAVPRTCASENRSRIRPYYVLATPSEGGK